ncbi:FMN phosphatase YigB (HAD superfamily) [Stenotrophomonas sp. SORGH_AS282]|nr:FMN phosphatase YigB (HAD superfamily) [Stenotrophomonas sp. SORGH_AS_0282]
MNFPVLAITLDLDDTLWPFAPIGARIDQVLYEWMLQHSPATAAMYPVAAMRELRERSFRDNPHLHYDLSALRRLTLREALENSGADLALLEPAYEAFYAARNQVEFYPDAVDALARIAARVPVAALSNGNADLARIGLDHHFAFQLGSREHGAAKPARQHLPRRLRAPGRGPGAGAARGRPHRNGRGGRDAGRPARLLDQPRRTHLAPSFAAA